MDISGVYRLKIRIICCLVDGFVHESKLIEFAFPNSELKIVS